MLPNVDVPDRPSAKRSAFTHTGSTSESTDSLFERVAWLYAFCRERLFRDDTDRIIAALWPNRSPSSGVRVVELGCGPGFYSRKLAQQFPQIAVTGVDRSERQLCWARERVNAGRINNCSFELVNVLSLPCADGSFDALIASRIFTILPERRRAVAEMFRVLRTGGRCFIAEPRYAFWASIPLFSMWLLASVIHSGNGYREPKKATVLNSRAFEQLFNHLPWKSVRVWRDGRYQYALCEKG
ncbi:MAG TPA: class I SAM-dependent methyltransferase [Chthoniobacterales bacterium]|nr:class I SAM-dependent methyltransferase [Chthoniobacterales bacterium]